MKISYGITVCDEVDELSRLLEHLYDLIDDNDEILILKDLDKTSIKLEQVINEFQEKYKHRLIEINFNLNKDFASFKNKLIEHASGDYLFQLDADEIPNEILIDNIKLILSENNVDVLCVPRVNKVIGLTKEHVIKWKWVVDLEDRINYPDVQNRILKLGKNIQWKYKVHEILENYSTISVLPYEDTEDFCLYHIKSIKKQEQQNNFYDTI
jgi:glycosyltransferase involved in cell wall biosynthesis